jgi:DNA-binding FadR family transcriptional regulator
LQHFVQLGLLERIKKRGTVIKPFSSGETDRSLAFCLRMGGFSFEEMKEARTIFETAILPCIIQRMTPGMLEKLESNLAEQNENIGSVEKFEELDRRFHTLLFETCQNRVLNLFSNVLAIVFQEKHRKRFRNTQWTQIGYENHKRILEAIRSRDEKTLNKLIYEHIIPT